MRQESKSHHEDTKTTKQAMNALCAWRYRFPASGSSCLRGHLSCFLRSSDTEADAALRLDLAHHRGREAREFLGGTHGPADQFAAAVGTAPAQHAVGAGRAEGAFERADTRLGAVGRQVAVAALAA